MGRFDDHPWWEVFEPRGGRVLGRVRAGNGAEAVALVAGERGVSRRPLDAVLVPIARLPDLRPIDGGGR